MPLGKVGSVRLCVTGAIVAAFGLLANGPQAGDLGLPEPLTAADFRPFDADRAALGRLLFYDKILSGNRNIACGTCHHHQLASADGVSLGIGEGGIGLGPERVPAAGADRPRARVPRNAPALFNLGHHSIATLFHDGRVSADDTYGRGFNTPAEEWLPTGLQSVLAAQALFPLLSPVEMMGEAEENEVAAARNRRFDLGWPVLVGRVAANADYVGLFEAAYDDVAGPGDILITHIANAIDDFINAEWRSFDSPFDRFLAGEAEALTARQRRGAGLFYGSAGCAACHGGPLLTDHRFRALALPPFGPGRVRRFDPHARDVGRMSETDRLEDAYRFRTPSLRNVTQTGPWGHNGAYGTLEAMIRHHSDPLAGLDGWDRGQVRLPADTEFAQRDFIIWEDRREMARYRNRIDRPPVEVAEADIADLIAFLDATTDPGALAGRLGLPDQVPSGLSVDRLRGGAAIHTIGPSGGPEKGPAR